MIYRNLFHVEGGLYSSEQSLFYRNRRVCTVVTEFGDRQDYNCRRRELYRYRDRLLKYQEDLKMAGFEIVETASAAGKRTQEPQQRIKLRTLEEAFKEMKK